MSTLQTHLLALKWGDDFIQAQAATCVSIHLLLLQEEWFSTLREAEVSLDIQQTGGRHSPSPTARPWVAAVLQPSSRGHSSHIVCSCCVTQGVSAQHCGGYTKIRHIFSTRVMFYRFQNVLMGLPKKAAQYVAFSFSNWKWLASRSIHMQNRR